MRYVVVDPVPGGEDFYRIADTFGAAQGNPNGENFAVADFFRDMPGAKEEARALCDRLNVRQAHIEAAK